jgi:hypothetical protein
VGHSRKTGEDACGSLKSLSENRGNGILPLLKSGGTPLLRLEMRWDAASTIGVLGLAQSTFHVPALFRARRNAPPPYYTMISGKAAPFNGRRTARSKAKGSGPCFWAASMQDFKPSSPKDGPVPGLCSSPVFSRCRSVETCVIPVAKSDRPAEYRNRQRGPFLRTGKYITIDPRTHGLNLYYFECSQFKGPPDAPDSNGKARR